MSLSNGEASFVYEVRDPDNEVSECGFEARRLSFANYEANVGQVPRHNSVRGRVFPLCLQFRPTHSCPRNRSVV